MSSNEIVPFGGNVDPIEVVDGELVDDTYQVPEPVLCEDCGHIHRGDSHPASLGAPCGSYLCCH